MGLLWNFFPEVCMNPEIIFSKGDFLGKIKISPICHLLITNLYSAEIAQRVVIVKAKHNFRGINRYIFLAHLNDELL